MSYTVSVIDCQPRVLASARAPFPPPGGLPSTLRGLWDSVYSFLRAHPEIRKTGHNIALYWSPPRSVQAGVEVESAFDGNDVVRCSATPAGRAAMTVHRGSVSRIGDANVAIEQFIRDNGYQHAGPSWEIYGDWQEDESLFETEVYYLISS